MIREATLADLDALVAMGEYFHASTPYSLELKNNPAQYRAVGAGLIEAPAGVLLVREVDGGPVGMLGGAIYDHPLSGERTAGELFWWSTPDHRGVTGIRLLRAFEEWAKARGAVYLQMVQPVWADRVGELYAALGYQKIEVAWTRHL